MEKNLNSGYSAMIWIGVGKSSSFFNNFAQGVAIPVSHIMYRINNIARESLAV